MSSSWFDVNVRWLRFHQISLLTLSAWQCKKAWEKSTLATLGRNICQAFDKLRRHASRYRRTIRPKWVAIVRDVLIGGSNSSEKYAAVTRVIDESCITPTLAAIYLRLRSNPYAWARRSAKRQPITIEIRSRYSYNTVAAGRNVPLGFVFGALPELCAPQLEIQYTHSDTRDTNRCIEIDSMGRCATYNAERTQD